MDNQEVGRAASQPGSQGSAPQPPSASSPVGADPSRERVRVILDCEWRDLRHALELVLDAKPTFDRHKKRPGWGWHWYRRGGPSMFVRQTKGGFSAMADKPQNTPRDNPESAG